MRFEDIKARLEASERNKPPDREPFLKPSTGGDSPPRRRTDSAEPAKPAEPARRIGPYQVEREIGRGGMGVVYLAARADEQFERRVAIKVMGASSEGGELLERFLNERQILAHLDHPNICRMFDGGMTDEGEPYLVMEYVRGALPIDEYCDQHKLTVRDRVELFKQVCRAVAYAHRLLIVHRDLKPENILVAGDGVVKLMDFGLAKNLFEPLSARRARDTGQRAMTPAYASPEQVRGEPIGTASDVYALGIVLYELLAGAHPFDRGDARGIHSLLESIAEETPPTPSARSAADRPDVAQRTAELRREASVRSLAKALAGDLDAIIMTALEKEPDKRYASVERLEDDLRRYLMNYPVSARSSTWNYRALKYSRRHRTALAVAAMFVLLVTGFGITTAVQAQRIARERDAARQVAGFLEELFENPDPARSGNAVTAREILDRGAARLTSELTEHPEMQARLLATMGKVYSQLGLAERSLELYRKSLDARRRQFGADSLEVAESLAGMSKALYDRSEYAEGEKAARESLRIRRGAVGSAHESVAESLNHIGLNVQSRGRLDEAEALFLEAAGMLDELQRTETALYAVISSNLGGLYTATAKWPEAENRFRRALELRRKQLPAGHPRIAFTMVRLGQVLNAEGRYRESEELLREALDIQAKHLPPDHPEITQTYNNLASLLQDKGDFEAAEPLYRKSLANNLKREGENHTASAVGYNNLATLLESMARLAEARSIFEKSLAIRKRLYGENHASVARTMNNLARVLAQEGDVLAAEQTCLRALQIRQKVLPAGHPDIASSWQTFGLIAETKQETGDAVEWYTKALSARRKSLHRQNLNTTDSMLALSRMYLRQGHAREAEELAREAIAVRAEVLPADNWRLAEARSVHGATLAALGRFQESERLLEESNAILKTRPQTAAIREALEYLPAMRRARTLAVPKHGQ